MIEMELQGRGELFYLGLPIGKQTSRCNNQGFLLCESTIFFVFQQCCNYLQCFTQPHIVGNYATKTNLSVAIQPGKSPLLVGTKRGVDSLRKRDVLLFGQLFYQFLYLIGKGNDCAI